MQTEIQQAKDIYDWSYLSKEVLSLKDAQMADIQQGSWKIADIDYWLNGNLPYN